MLILLYSIIFFFFFNDTATTEIYTLSLHDALPISRVTWSNRLAADGPRCRQPEDRKSTRLNSSHANISYAVFCLKKKKKMLCKNKKKQKKKKKKKQKNQKKKK